MDCILELVNQDEYASEAIKETAGKAGRWILKKLGQIGKAILRAIDVLISKFRKLPMIIKNKLKRKDDEYDRLVKENKERMEKAEQDMEEISNTIKDTNQKLDDSLKRTSEIVDKIKKKGYIQKPSEKVTKIAANKENHTIEVHMGNGTTKTMTPEEFKKWKEANTKTTVTRQVKEPRNITTKPSPKKEEVKKPEDKAEKSSTKRYSKEDEDRILKQADDIIKRDRERKNTPKTAYNASGDAKQIKAAFDTYQQVAAQMMTITTSHGYSSADIKIDLLKSKLEYANSQINNSMLNLNNNFLDAMGREISKEQATQLFELCTTIEKSLVDLKKKVEGVYKPLMKEDTRLASWMETEDKASAHLGLKDKRDLYSTEKMTDNKNRFDKGLYRNSNTALYREFTRNIQQAISMVSKIYSGIVKGLD